MEGLLPEATNTGKGLYPEAYINTVKHYKVTNNQEYLLGSYSTPAGSAVYLAFRYIAGNSGDCLIATVTMGRSGGAVPRFGIASNNIQQPIDRFFEIKYKIEGDIISFYLKVNLFGAIVDEIPYSLGNFMKTLNFQTTTIPEDAIKVEFV